jgi:zinc transporter ZupT
VSWAWPLLAGFIVSTAALVGSGAILLLGQKAEQASTWLLSFAIGTLLGAATLGLLPEALEHAPAERVMPLLLTGMPIPGALLAFTGASFWRESIGWLLPLVAGGFIYIALADLVPALHHRRGVRAGFFQMLLILAGILVLWWLGQLHHG